MATNNKNKGIITLVFLLVVGFFALGLVMTTATKTILELKKNYNTISGDRTFYTAEAAAREGVYQYINDSEYSGGDFQVINNVSNSSTSIVDIGWPYVAVKGIAENNITHREVMYTLHIFPEGLAFDYAIYAENNLNLRGGNQNIITGDIFANNGIDCNGNPTINGDAYSPGNIDSNCNDPDEIFSDVEPIPPPEIKLEDYYNIATFIASSTDAEDALNGNATTGIIFVDDAENETVINNTDLTGSLAVNGDLRIGGGTVINSINNYAAIVVSGDLTVTGNNTITGVVYVSGNTTFGHGNTTIIGSLISVGGMSTDVFGSVNIEFSSSTLIWGLSTTTTATPRIIDWSEQ